ncbi:MAG TPA: hypothetical protein VF656_10305 [Pyrinomonadaceae bacterium]|jgi:hypothetical protein
MSLTDLANISTIAQAILVIISLFFIWYQLRQSTELVKAANSQALVEHAASFNALLIENGDLADLWYGFGQSFPDETSAKRYRELLVQWLIFHENIYYQRRRGLLDSEIYNSWLEDLKFTVNHHNVEIVTKDIRKFFPGKFGDHMIELKTTFAFSPSTHDAS